jgi:hypothetical protein
MDRPDSVVTNINQIITVPASENNNIVNRKSSNGKQNNGLTNQSTNSTASAGENSPVNTASKRPKSKFQMV